MFKAQITVRVGTFDLDIGFEAGNGETVALLGPNGAGKTTTLRSIAGLQPLDEGRIELDDDVLDEPATGTFVPTAARSIGVVFQDYLLFPRLSALENVAFGLRARGVHKHEARRRAGEWLERLDLAGQAKARPRTLSGGQAQRVALARALSTAPRLLLLDEPLAALDARTRMRVRSDLRRHLRSFSGARILVTHDPVDAMVLADRLIILESGRISQAGTVGEVTRHPRSDYVAELVGVTLLEGRRTGEHVVRLASGGELTVADPLAADDLAVAIRPQAVALHRACPEGSPRNVWLATVIDLQADHDRVRVELAGPVPLVAEVTPAAVAALELGPGTSVWATVKAVDLVAYAR